MVLQWHLQFKKVRPGRLFFRTDKVQNESEQKSLLKTRKVIEKNLSTSPHREFLAFRRRCSSAVCICSDLSKITPIGIWPEAINLIYIVYLNDEGLFELGGRSTSCQHVRALPVEVEGLSVESGEVRLAD